MTQDRYERHKEIMNELHDIYVQKNMAYGDSFDISCDDFGITAALVRMSDKFNRLKNLAKNPDISKGDESLQDTLMDLANYCILTKMWLEKENKNEN